MFSFICCVHSQWMHISCSVAFNLYMLQRVHFDILSVLLFSRSVCWTWYVWSEQRKNSDICDVLLRALLIVYAMHVNLLWINKVKKEKIGGALSFNAYVSYLLRSLFLFLSVCLSLSVSLYIHFICCNFFIDFNHYFVISYAYLLKEINNNMKCNYDDERCFFY